MSHSTMFKRIKLLLVTMLMVLIPAVATPTMAFAYSSCGSGSMAYKPSIDLGCQGKGNPILDLLFAVIRFLSIGVGLVITMSLVYAGIQYIGSRGDPNANAMAVKRIQSNVTALLIFIFAYAFVNYIIPGQLLQ